MDLRWRSATSEGRFPVPDRRSSLKRPAPRHRPGTPPTPCHHLLLPSLKLLPPKRRQSRSRSRASSAAGLLTICGYSSDDYEDEYDYEYEKVRVGGAHVRQTALKDVISCYYAAPGKVGRKM